MEQGNLLFSNAFRFVMTFSNAYVSTLLIYSKNILKYASSFNCLATPKYNCLREGDGLWHSYTCHIKLFLGGDLFWRYRVELESDLKKEFIGVLFN